MSASRDEHVVDLLLRYVDSELDDAARRRVERHCAGCEACAREMTALTALRDDMANAAAPRLEKPLWPGVRARLRTGVDGRPVNAAGATQRSVSWGLGGTALAAGLALGLVLGGGSVGTDDGSTAAANDLLGGAESVVLGTGDATLGGLWLGASQDGEDG
jgi:anti-sigma factor RsiW